MTKNYKNKGEAGVQDTYPRKNYVLKDERARNIVDKKLKEENDYSEWVFVGWSPSIGPATSDQTYIAVFELIIEKYDITWKDADGTILATVKVEHGTIPSYVLPKDNQQWRYIGWDKEVVDVTSNTTYQAIRELQKYTLTFNSNGGSSVSKITQDYDSTVVEPTNPSKEGQVFIGWYSDADLTQEVSWPLILKENITLYAVWNERVPYLGYLQALLGGYQLNPYSFIPNAMKPAANLVNIDVINHDYSNVVQINQIAYGGHGEQWNMVLANMNQSQVFFNMLSIVELLSETSAVAFNNHLDSNPSDSANYDFYDGIYHVTIKFENNIIYFVIDYTGNIALIGEVQIQIALSHNIETLEKEGRIQLGDTNALKYSSSADHYEFGIKYGGIRRAYIHLTKDGEGNVEGKIFEYLGIDEYFTLGSSAQFYINEEYVSVVGNKASGMIGWTGTINELYRTNEGKLIGYEVRETLLITYNTLWFNLNDTSGITSIRKEVAPIENANPDLIYVNGAHDAFVTEAFGGITPKMLSRRYDIEFRTQYVYFIENDEVRVAAIEVPMLFVQQERLAELVADVQNKNNNISSFSLNVPIAYQNKIMSDYSTLIDVFIVQKEEHTYQTILDYIGEAY
ncbi:MAG: InlB B-repeat-containing protein [Acholeplasmataceae bacterium]